MNRQCILHMHKYLLINLQRTFMISKVNSQLLLNFYFYFFFSSFINFWYKGGICVVLYPRIYHLAAMRLTMNIKLLMRKSVITIFFQFETFLLFVSIFFQLNHEFPNSQNRLFRRGEFQTDQTWNNGKSSQFIAFKT